MNIDKKLTRNEDEVPAAQEGKGSKRFKTFLLGLAFFSVGASYGSFNTALPDLVELYETTTSNMSVMFIITAVGKICMGVALGAGWVNMQNPFLMFFLALLTVSGVVALIPYSGYWQVLIVNTFLLGFSNGLLFAGGCACCLQLWRSLNLSESYMNCLHFMHSCGFLFAPTTASLILPNKQDDLGLEIIPGIYGVTAYMLAMAVMLLAFTPPFLYMAVKYNQEDQTQNFGDSAKSNAQVKMSGCLSWTLLVVCKVFGLMFFLGMVVWSVGLLLTTFAASPNSGTGLTRREGAQLGSIFFTCLTLARLVAIFISTRFKASRTIYLNMGMILTSCCLLVLRQSSMQTWELMTYVGIMGFGVGPLYSLTMMNLEEFIPINSQASGVLYVFHNAGLLSVAWALGQFVDEHPYLLFVSCIFSTGLLMVTMLVLTAFRTKIIGKLDKLHQ